MLNRQFLVSFYVLCFCKIKAQFQNSFQKFKLKKCKNLLFFIFLQGGFLLHIRWHGVRGYFLAQEFQNSLRHCERSEAISRNSKFILRNSRFALPFKLCGRDSKSQGILEFRHCEGAKRPKLGILDFYPRNSKFPVIPKLDPRISIRNSRIFVIASEAKQSLEILNSSLEF